MLGIIKQSSAVEPLIFLLVSSADGVTGVTGASPTVVISKNGGSFAAPSGAVSEIGNGWYKLAANATDSNTLGKLILHATATGALPSDTIYQVVAFDPEDAQRLGLASLPGSGTAAAPGAAMDLIESPNQSALAAIAAALFDLSSGVETTLTFRQAMRGITAVLLGTSTDDGTTFRDVNDTTNRVAATVDSYGDRTAVALNLD
jgi:hypothetical protein